MPKVKDCRHIVNVAAARKAFDALVRVDSETEWIWEGRFCPTRGPLFEHGGSIYSARAFTWCRSGKPHPKQTQRLVSRRGATNVCPYNTRVERRANGAPRRFAAHEAARVVAAFQQGASARELATRHRVAVTTIYRIVRDAKQGHERVRKAGVRGVTQKRNRGKESTTQTPPE